MGASPEQAMTRKFLFYIVYLISLVCLFNPDLYAASPETKLNRGKEIKEKAPEAVRAALDLQVTEAAPFHTVSTNIEKPVL